MENEFVSYEMALALKEFGFNEPCFTYYKNDQLSNILELVKNSEMKNVNNEVDNYISAPTFSQAFRFFRDKFNLFSCVELHIIFPIRYFFIIDKIGNDDFVYYTEDKTIFYDKYKDAEIACLKLLIEIVENRLV